MFLNPPKITLTRKSVYISLILSYIAVAIVFIIFLFSSYINSTSILQNEIKEKNVHLLNQIQTGMDDIIDDISTLGNQIILNDNIMDFTNHDKSPDGNTQYLISRISDMLKNYRALYGNTTDIFVYSVKNDYILSSKVSNSTHDFHEMYYPDIPYDEWLGCVASETVTYNSFAMSTTSGSSPVIMLSKPLVSMHLEDTGAYLAVVIDSDAFLKLFDKYSGNKAYSFLIIDSANNVLCRNKTAQTLTDYPLYSQLPDNNNIYEKDGLFCAYSTSGITSWKYLSVAPMRVVLEKSYNMLIFNIIILIASILVFIVLCGYLLKKNYNPVSSIISMIGPYENDKIENEYDYIKQAITDAFSKNRALSTQLEKQNFALRNNLLQHLLKGSAMLPAENFSNLGINFGFDYYIVCIYYIDDCSELFFDENSDKNDNCKLANIIISNVVSELMNESGTGYILEMDGMLVGIYNGKTIQSSEAAVKKANKTAQTFAADNFNLYFSVAQSSVAGDISHISAAYKEALDVLEYKVVMCNTDNLTAEDLRNKTKYEYNYSLNLEQQLINSIKLGSLESAKNTMDEIFELNFEKSTPTLPIIQCLLFNIISTMIKAISDVSLMYKEEFVDNYVAIDNLIKCKTVPELKIELDKVLAALCEFIQSKKKDNEEGIENRITEFVNENYAQSTLSVTSIAEHLNMSMSYVSSIFKQRTDMGLLEYINSVRVEKSIELLKDNSLKINDIANMVGYDVPRTFLNIFKKVTGLTPSQYRELKLKK